MTFDKVEKDFINGTDWLVTGNEVRIVHIVDTPERELNKNNMRNAFQYFVKAYANSLSLFNGVRL